eukprot:CAMPEP_0172451908 /NCGR_PEP_ID=MMETSP1065-20121228/9734_1 /TAXON_ID=265537 /ORGANISM="Amphiprora paludosa, Strain CCMP125" /LENGTH=455 /DNA_ID=CAMNT_0013203879 /DNA_START=96 /DNA_END=1460 /DNA_ORIENTATION=-
MIRSALFLHLIVAMAVLFGLSSLSLQEVRISRGIIRQPHNEIDTIGSELILNASHPLPSHNGTCYELCYNASDPLRYMLGTGPQGPEPLQDLLHALKSSVSSNNTKSGTTAIVNPDNQQEQGGKVKNVKEIHNHYLTFLMIGDSLDRKLVVHLCNSTEATDILMEPFGQICRFQKPTSAVGDHDSVVRLQSVTMASLRIYGMSHLCSNGGTAQQYDPDSVQPDINRTSDRISKLLPLYFMPRLLENPSQNGNKWSQDQSGNIKGAESQPQYHHHSFYVMVGSSLWDLSRGCNNRRLVRDEYLADYERGIRDVFNSTQHVFATAGKNTISSSRTTLSTKIFGRTSNPVSREYSENRKAGARNRPNQQALNHVMKATVQDMISSAENNTEGNDPNNSFRIQGVVDWWDFVAPVNNTKSGFPSEEQYSRELSDGRHFKKSPCPTIAFFNLWLNQALAW